MVSLLTTTNSMDAIQKMQMVCYWLIEQCIQTEAEEMKITQQNVTKGKENLGDWEIIVKKKK